MKDILITKGKIVNSDKDFFSDILIRDGKISEIGKNLSATDNAELIDAGGKFVFPGAIDPHVHMHLPTPAGFSADDFYTGSKAALAGGTTSIIDFVTPQRGQSLIEALDIRLTEAESSLSNFSLHMSPVEWSENTAVEIQECILKRNIRSFKVYTAYRKAIGLEIDEIRKVMQVLAKHKVRLAVHCEDENMIDFLRKDLVERGQLAPKFHAESRPPVSEAGMVRKILDLGLETSCPLYLVHMSSALSLHHISVALERGQDVVAETCPQYLLFDESVYESDFERASAFVMSPPIRTSKDNAILWKALEKGTIQTVGTDHCPFNKDQKIKGKGNFTLIPNGAGGLEYRLSALFTFGVLEDKISLKKFVELTSTAAAKAFDLYPAKGVISEGADADILIWDPEYSFEASQNNQIQHCDLNIFEGMNLKGKADTVIRAGEVVLSDFHLLENIKKGSYLNE